MLGMVRERLEQEHQAAARTDPLTGLANRRAFLEVAAGRLRRHRQGRRPAAVLMFDLDHFKRVNDRFGHAVGDRVLCAFARAAGAQLRAEDVISRIGGEEFAAFLPDTGAQEAVAAANRVRVAFANAAEDVGGVLVGTTVSAGVALAGEDENLEPMLARADQALYAAKSRGRNRVELAAPPPSDVTPLDAARRGTLSAADSPSLAPDDALNRSASFGKQN
jgi:diguanylate cyclase (GGDEF)-like protein